MSSRADKPGYVHVGPVTVATKHRDPVVIEGFAGIASKIDQAQPITDPASQAQIDAATTIAVGVEALVDLVGEHPVRTALLPGGVANAVGTQLWINPADNTLHNATAAGYLKFGIVSGPVDEPFPGVQLVNLNERAAF